MAKCIGPSDDEECPEGMNGHSDSNGRCLSCYVVFQGRRHYESEGIDWTKCGGPAAYEDCPYGNDAQDLSSRVRGSCESCKEIQDERSRRERDRSTGYGPNEIRPGFRGGGFDNYSWNWANDD